MDPADPPRWVAPGGWRRVAVGLVIGAVIGELLARSVEERTPAGR